MQQFDLSSCIISLIFGILVVYLSCSFTFQQVFVAGKVFVCFSFGQLSLSQVNGLLTAVYLCNSTTLAYVATQVEVYRNQFTTGYRHDVRFAVRDQVTCFGQRISYHFFCYSGYCNRNSNFRFYLRLILVVYFLFIRRKFPADRNSYYDQDEYRKDDSLIHN
ncbi:hypothetical protein D9M68_781270 [compost metagenome]